MGRILETTSVPMGDPIPRFEGGAVFYEGDVSVASLQHVTGGDYNLFILEPRSADIMQRIDHYIALNNSIPYDPDRPGVPPPPPRDVVVTPFTKAFRQLFVPVNWAIAAGAVLVIYAIKTVFTK